MARRLIPAEPETSQMKSNHSAQKEHETRKAGLGQDLQVALWASVGVSPGWMTRVWASPKVPRPCATHGTRGRQLDGPCPVPQPMAHGVPSRLRIENIEAPDGGQPHDGEEGRHGERHQPPVSKPHARRPGDQDQGRDHGRDTP